MRTIFLLATIGLLPLAAAETEDYFFGFLKSAPDRAQLPKEEAAKIQQAHLAHLGKMFEKGPLKCAGPLGGGGVHRGVILYQTATLEDATAMANADPAVQAGQLVSEFHRWTGPKGIGQEYMQRYRAAGGKLEMKMTKYHLLMLKPGTPSRREVARRTGKLSAAGPSSAGEILILQAMSADELKQLAGDAAQLSLDWYVAEGVLPAASLEAAQATRVGAK